MTQPFNIKCWLTGRVVGVEPFGSNRFALVVVHATLDVGWTGSVPI